MNEIIKRYTPEFIKNIYRAFKKHEQLKAYRGNKVYCPICKSHFSHFAPFGNPVRENALCPKCNSLERDRLVYLFIENSLEFFYTETTTKLLHFAPERSFFRIFSSSKTIEYFPCDLYPENFTHFAGNKVNKEDITTITYQKDTFDFVLCNHVLEHIPDDQLAMKELLRVMAKNGAGIFQVPLDYNRDETYEDFSITTEEGREKAFGQKDHVRWYGKDYNIRLKNAGFEVNEYQCSDMYSKKEIFKYGLIPSETVYFCKKK
ncbi:class I SAM-dependent methyltransferase [Draconibacterium halophilum]|uniref:Class I SAM-dependent methyltransferase n=1 Tax=Draconibacterium halophilum TaxID=2706887 RepID=A0A6C0R8S6_9BACT|nr:methyltransferase domain-containing protein [Draconibacterium halophilum]QIA06720.1 class I SAM-dependent methyltransferase [Draconibacterium halophilum]